MTDSQTDGLVTEEYDLEKIIEENQHLKKKLGDQGNELGQLRKGMDYMLQQQAQKEDDLDDWDADPVSKEVSAVKNELSSLKQEAALRDLESKHPGFRETSQSDEFQGWVTKSKYRSNLYGKADAMDLDAADELFTAWEESQEFATSQHQEERANRSEELKKASMEKGSAGGMKKTVYSRTALIDMQINNPAKYEAMRDEIMQAYNEGRVKK